MVDRQFIVRRAGQKANVLTGQRKSHGLLDAVQERRLDQILGALGEIPGFERFAGEGDGAAASIGDLEIGLPSSARQAVVAKKTADCARTGRRDEMPPAAHMGNPRPLSYGRFDDNLRDWAILVQDLRA